MPRLTRGQRLIAELRAKGIKASRPAFPDLCCDKPGLAPLSNVIAIPGHHTAPVRHTTTIPDGFLIGNSHKQGLQLMPRSDAAWAGGKKS